MLHLQRNHLNSSSSEYPSDDLSRCASVEYTSLGPSCDEIVSQICFTFIYMQMLFEYYENDQNDIIIYHRSASRLVWLLAESIYSRVHSLWYQISTAGITSSATKYLAQGSLPLHQISTAGSTPSATKYTICSIVCEAVCHSGHAYAGHAGHAGHSGHFDNTTN